MLGTEKPHDQGPRPEVASSDSNLHSKSRSRGRWGKRDFSVFPSKSQSNWTEKAVGTGSHVAHLVLGSTPPRPCPACSLGAWYRRVLPFRLPLRRTYQMLFVCLWAFRLASLFHVKWHSRFRAFLLNNGRFPHKVID